MTTEPATTATTASALPLARGPWTLDATHATVSFWVRHLGVAKVRGRFGRFDAVLEVGPTAAQTHVRATIDTASIDTGNADRDAHLRTADFLDVTTHPQITFTSTAITGSGDTWAMTGDLTIMGTTRPVTLDVALGGVEDFLGQPHAGFTARTRIDRRDFGVPYTLPPGAPSVALGDLVHLDLDLEFVATT